MLKPGQSCSECGAPVSGSAGLGLCSVCALQEALAAGTARAGGGPIQRAGDYELLDEIARGGMGVVYRARQRSLNRVVALKVLLGGAFAGEENRNRLKAEAAVVARLRHPNIVTVHDSGELDGQPFYSMDFVAGRTLAELVRDGPLRPRQAANYLARIAGAVQHAHDHGVLHRDLKPSNVLIDVRDEPQVTDFGLARLMESAPGTVTGAVLGSPAYMPPEQALGRSREVSAASDVYALGAVLYELLTGRPPFFAESPQAVLELVKTREPVAPRQLNASVPADLETICLKCLAKEPDRRYPTARLLRGDLERFLRGEPVLARPLGALGRTWRWARRRPALAALAGLALAAVGAVMVISTVSAARIRASRDAAEARLAETLLAQARAQRDLGEAEHRARVFELVEEARRLDGSGRLTVPLREEVIAALARPDHRLVTATNVPAESLDLMLVCFDRSFERCATADARGVAIVRVADGAEVQRLPIAPAPDEITAFSPDGKFLSVRRRGALEVWHLDSATCVIPGAGGEGMSLGVDTFSTDSRHFARGETGNRIAIHELRAAAPATKLRDWPGPDGSPSVCLVWSPDGNSIALATDDRRLAVCDAVTGGVRWKLDSVEGVWRLAWNEPLQLLAVTTGADRVLLFNTNDGSRARDINTPTEASSSVAFSSDGRLLAVASERFGTRLFDPLTGHTHARAANGSWHAHFAAGGRRLGTLFARAHPLWLEWLPAPVMHPLAPDGATPINQVLRFSADGRQLASLTRDGVVLWDVEQRAVSRTVPVLSPTGLAFATDERLLVAAKNSILAFDLAPGGAAKAPEVPQRVVHSGVGFWGVDVSAARGWQAAADHRGGQVVIADRDRRVLRKIDSIVFPGYVAFSPAGDWLACGAGTNVFVQRLDALDHPPQRIPGAGEVIQFSGDGQWLLSRGSQVNLWRTGTWEPGPPLPEFSGRPPSAAALSHDSRWLAAAWSDGDVQLIDLTSAAVVAVLNGPGDSRIIDLAFSPDGRHLAAARGQGEVQLWDLVSTNEELDRRGLGW